MNIELKNIADIQTGLVLTRKESNCGENAVKYRRLTLRSTNDSGVVSDATLEDFYSSEHLQGQMVTHSGDIIVRTMAPLYPTIITDEYAGLIVPSQLISIRITSDSILPEYLLWWLAQDKISQKVASEDTGIALRLIKAGILAKLEIPIIPLEKQHSLANLCRLSKRKQALLTELVGQEKLLREGITQIATIQDGGKR